LLGLRVIRLGWRGVRNAHYRSHGSDIGYRRRCLVNSLHIVTIVWSPAGAPKMLIVAVKVTRPGAIPAIGMPTGMVIGPVWLCLGPQGA
jgi:hypothetical protein